MNAPSTLTTREQLDALQGGFRQSQVLLTANRLGVFQTLGGETRTSDELAEQLNCNQRGMRILCDALVAIGLLLKKEGRYCNSPVALEHLLPGQPGSMTAILFHAAKLYERWGKLFDAVKTGEQVPDETLDPRLMGDEKDFAQAMADVGRLSAQQTADLLDLTGVKSMLDVGGGPGLYAIELARKNPDLQATIFDNIKTLEVAQENIDKAGLQDRVQTKPGDAFNDDLGKNYDFILLSNVIHIYSYEQNQTLVKKCADTLTPGGRLCLKDFFLDEDRTSPEWSALFAINMLVSTEQGDCFTLQQAKEWLHQAGLRFDSLLEMTSQTRLVIGTK